MTKKCPSDMFSEWTILDIFYYGLSEFSKMSLDHSAGGSIHLKKTPEEAQEFIDMVANNQFMYTSERNSVNNGIPQKKGVLEIDALNAILAQNKMLTQQVNMISQSLNGWQHASNSTKEAASEEAYDPENPAMAEVNYMGEPYGTPIIHHGEIIQISPGRINKSLNKALIMVEEIGLTIVNLFYHPLSNRQRTLNKIPLI